MTLSRWLVVLAVLGLSDGALASPLDGYLSRCEVKQIAGWRGISVGRAKKQLRDEIARGEKAFWDEALKARSVKARCRFADTGLTPYDAEVLAGFWGVDTKTAKATVEQKYREGYGDAVWWAIEDAKWKVSSVEGEYYEGDEYDPGAEDVERFWKSDYHYCDARVLAETWGIGVYDAKQTIGMKLGWGDPATMAFLDGELARGRVIAMSTGRACQWGELSYGYDDAEALARFWGMDVGRAKLRIADLVSRSQDRDVRQQLAIARRGY